MAEGTLLSLDSIERSLDALIESAGQIPLDPKSALVVADQAQGVGTVLQNAPVGWGAEVDFPRAVGSDDAIVAVTETGLFQAMTAASSIVAVQLVSPPLTWQITYGSETGTESGARRPQLIIVTDGIGFDRCWSFEHDESVFDCFDQEARADRQHAQRNAWVDLGSQHEEPGAPEWQLPTPTASPDTRAGTELESESNEEVGTTSDSDDVSSETLLLAAPADEVESASTPAPAVSEAAAEPVVESYAPEPHLAFGPTHRIADAGTTIGSVDSGTPPSRDLARSLVQVIGISESGWAHVVCQNGAVCWVDPADLRALHAEPEAAERVLFWFYVLEPVAVVDGDGAAVGGLEPGTWFEAHREEQGWVATVDGRGNRGWVPGNRIHKQR